MPISPYMGRLQRVGERVRVSRDGRRKRWSIRDPRSQRVVGVADTLVLKDAVFRVWRGEEARLVFVEGTVILDDPHLLALLLDPRRRAFSDLDRGFVAVGTGRPLAGTYAYAAFGRGGGYYFGKQLAGRARVAMAKTERKFFSARLGADEPRTQGPGSTNKASKG